MSKPSWLAKVREFCKQERIEIAGWGDHAIVVVAKSDEVAKRMPNNSYHWALRRSWMRPTLRPEC